MTTKPDANSQLDCLLAAVGDDLLNLTGQDLYRLTSSLDLDSDNEAAWVSAAIASHVGEVAEPGIKAAQNALDRAEKSRKSQQAIPSTPEARRRLFERLRQELAGTHEEGLTYAFRDEQELSDRDIEGILEDLESLGVLRNDNSEE